MRLWGMITDNKKIDLVFIDGSHQYEDVMADFCNCYDHVKENGWIVMHDIRSERYPGVDRVWDELAGKILIEQRFHTTLGAGRKSGPLPRWARLNAEKLVWAHERINP